jgi:hypothetical protein
MNVRFQMGATRGRLLLSMSIENGAVALVSCCGAFAIATTAMALFQGLLPQDIAVGVSRVPVIVAIAVGAVLFTVLATGVSLWRTAALRTHLVSGPNAAAIVSRSAGRNALLATQMGLAICLTVVAALFSRSANRLVDGLGYSLDNTFVLDLSVASRASSPAFADGTGQKGLLSRVLSAPGVDAGALSSGGFLGLGSSLIAVGIRNGATTTRDELPRLYAVTSRYFESLGTPILQGRAFQETDNMSAESVVILSQRTAAELFGDEPPLGKSITIGRGVGRVIGVSASRRDESLVVTSLEAFVPTEQSGRYGLPLGSPSLLIIKTAAPQIAFQSLSSILAATPGAPPALLRPLADEADQKTRLWRMGGAILAVFSAVAVAVSFLGVYAVIGSIVKNRLPELGVRASLGASRAHLVTHVLKNSAGWVVAGLLLGIGGGLGLARILRAWLFGITATDVPSFSIALAVVAAAGLCGAVAPAWRAAQADPISVLRSRE